MTLSEIFTDPNGILPMGIDIHICVSEFVLIHE